jgi:hypothetical protein
MSWLAPVLALVGTLIATLVGYYKFKKVNNQNRNSRYLSIKSQVLSELLDTLHYLELKSRNGDITADQLNSELIRLNKKFIMEYNFALDPQEKRWARDYIEGLVAIHIGMQNTSTEVYDWWASTAAQPIPIEVRGAFKRVEQADDGLKKSLRVAMKGKASGNSEVGPD